MYTVQVHCAVPKHVELTESMLRQLARRNLSNDDFKILCFDDKDALFHYVRAFDYIDIYGGQRNRFLDATMVNVKDSRRHRQYFDSRQEYNFRSVDCYPGVFECYYLGYLASDSSDRVIDLRNYVRELYKFDDVSYKAFIRQSRNAKWSLKVAQRDARWEKAKMLTEGKDYWSYYRRIKTTRERRYAADSDHKPFVRGRRSFASLPSAYDDLYFHREKSWKARTKRRRKWEVNLSRHIDTVRQPPKWNEDLYDSALEEDNYAHKAGGERA